MKEEATSTRRKRPKADGTREADKEARRRERERR